MCMEDEIDDYYQDVDDIVNTREDANLKDYLCI